MPTIHEPQGRTARWSDDRRIALWVSPCGPTVWFQGWKKRTWLVHEGGAVRSARLRGECADIAFLADGSVLTQAMYPSTKLGRADAKGRTMGGFTLEATVTSISGARDGAHVWASAARHVVRIDASGVLDAVELDAPVAYVQALGAGVVATIGAGAERRHVLLDGAGTIEGEARGALAVIDRWGRSVRIRDPLEGSPERLSLDGASEFEEPVLSIDALGGPVAQSAVDGVYQLQWNTYWSSRRHTLARRAIAAGCSPSGERVAWVEADRVVIAAEDELDWQPV